MSLLSESLEGNYYTSQSLISVVIPFYNQGRTIPASLKRIRKVLGSLSRYELIAVNDGSSDDTLQVLQAEQASDPSLKIVSYSQNMGKGYAVKRGVVETKGDVVIFTDGDLEISPDIILEYIHQLKACDLVIASKRHPLSKVKTPFSRKFLSRAFNLVARIATGVKAKDTQSGLKAGNGEALRRIFGLMLVKRYAFDVELLAIASLLKMNIKEMPVDINLDKRFRMKEVAKMLVDVLAVSYRLRIIRWYQSQLEREKQAVTV
jgi:glycosyltransferase involved in cell wall biosynthesis